MRRSDRNILFLTGLFFTGWGIYYLPPLIQMIFGSVIMIAGLAMIGISVRG